MSFVVPAVLPASRKDLEERLALFSRIPSVTRVQIDVVDGTFAAPASWPYTAPAELQTMIASGEVLPYADRFEYEIDLMCLDADRAIGAWLAVGASRLLFHAESVIDVSRLLTAARERYGQFIPFGLALNIVSDSALIEPYLGDVEFVQFMGIERIGRQGQPLDQRIFEKIRAFRARHPEIPIQVDGGISLANAGKCIALGVSNLIIGSGILRASDPAAAVAAFNALY